MKKQHGFTLIELMIVIAIVAILAGIGYPAYLEQQKDARRGDAQAALLSFAAAMERYYTNEGAYNTAAVGDKDAGFPKDDVFNSYVPLDASTSADADYILKIAKSDTTTFTINAIPQNNMKDDYTFQYQSTGRKRRGKGTTWTEGWDN